MRTTLVALTCCCLVAPWPAKAQTSEPDTVDDLPPPLVARLKLANTLYDQDNLAAALVEYRRVQVESGKAPGLFNVGRICARLNRPVEAVAEFDKLLAAPGRTPEQRLEEARQLRDEQRARIGRLMIQTKVPAFIEVDNVAVGKTEVKVFVGAREEPAGNAVPDMRFVMAHPIEVANGPHLVAAVAPGHAPLRQQIEIGGGVTKEFELALVPAKGELAHIRVRTPVLGAEIRLDGAQVGRTPIDVTLSVEAGAHELALQRKGYRTTTLRRDLGEGQTWDADVVMEEDPTEMGWQAGQLLFEGEEPGSALSVNGKLRDFRGGAVKLPPGPHQIELAHSGFLPYRAEVDIESGKSRRLHVEMEATAEARHERLDRVSGQRWRAWSTLAAGALIAGGGGVYLGWAIKNRTQANNYFDQVQTEFISTTGKCYQLSATDVQTAQACKEDQDRANNDQNNAKYHVIGSAVATGVGAAVLVTGLIMVLTIDDTSRYEAPHSSLAWLGWVKSNGGGVSLAGRF
ncbi:MAG TPA: PEGA domain-containing protein [Polyangia bacterium]|jgi:PEGA domain.|nr:PEGA domain-containing protein [Polyangia bacterium]